MRLTKPIPPRPRREPVENDKPLEYAPTQPRPLFNHRCHLNALHWSRTHGLRFAWTLATENGHKYVHAVCLDAEGRIVDPTLGDYARECCTMELLDVSAPSTFRLANTRLARLKRKHERGRRGWFGWLRSLLTRSTPPEAK